MNRKGFTLIELLITIAVMAIALTAVSGILVAIVKVQQKQNVVIEVESYGADVISLIEQVVRTNENVSVDLENLRLVYYDKNGNVKYIGLATVTGPPDHTCGSQGYVYNSTVDVSSGRSVPLYDVVTDDSETNGVNVTNLDFQVTGTNPLWLTASVTIEKPPCSSVFSDNLSSTFTTTVRSLR